MRQIVLSRCKPGFNKISMNHVLRDRARLSLSGAKTVVDRVLMGEEVLVEVADETVDDFIEDAKQCGVEARAIDHVTADDPRSRAGA